MMNYKGYSGTVTYDGESEILHGEVIGLKDVVTFQGTTVEELKQAFQDSIDDYLEFCAERGESPKRAFSGKFVIRIDPKLHRRIHEMSTREGESLNSWISARLEKLTEQQ